MKLLICGILLFAVQAHARFNVRLSVSGSDEVKKETETFIAGALRSLGDVDLYSEGDTNFCQYSIQVVALDLTLVNDRHTGYVLSFVVQRHTDIDEIVSQRLYYSSATKKYWKTISLLDSLIRRDGNGTSANDLFANGEIIMDRLQTCGNDELKNISESQIVDFDNEVLKPVRDLDKKTNNIFKK